MTDLSSPAGVDPRGLRFGAAITSLVLAVVLVTSSTALLAAQVSVFAVAVGLGVRRSPYSLLFAAAVRPRLGPPAGTEDARPPRFAQLVGLVFTGTAVTGLLAGFETFGLIAAGIAFGAAFVNAVFGLCLGCELYLLVQRIFPARTRVGTTPTEVSA